MPASRWLVLWMTLAFVPGCATCAGWVFRDYGDPKPRHHPACEVLSQQIFRSPAGERLWFTKLGYIELYHDETNLHVERLPYVCHRKTLQIRGEPVVWTPNERIEWSGAVWTLAVR